MRAVVAGLDPDMPIERVRTMSSVIADSLSQQQLTSILLSAFSLFAVVLAAVGVYVVVASSVALSRREIGVRLALGASTGTILLSFVRKGGLLAGLAAAIGIPATWAGARLLRPLVSGIRDEPIVIVGVALGLLVVAVAASYLPARRAARLDPLIVLRGD